jgi:YesN/AraC family two-component response regulator
VAGVLYLGSLRTDQRLGSVNGKTYQGPPIRKVTKTVMQQVRDCGSYLANTMVIILNQWKIRGHGLSKQKPGEFYKRSTLMFIRNKYHEDIKLEDLAGQLRMHPNYLGRIIEQQCEKTFRELLQDFRIEKSKIFLSAGEYSVTETAYGCGFNDSNYFSTVFKKHTGVTPSQYQKQIGFA